MWASYVNGIIERFHHQLKAALKSYPNPTDWSRSLPLVVLGIYFSLKEDLVGCTAAELVYGTTLRLPGGYFYPTPESSSLNAIDYVQQLKFTMSKLHAVPPRLPASQPFHVNLELGKHTHLTAALSLPEVKRSSHLINVCLLGGLYLYEVYIK